MMAIRNCYHSSLPPQFFVEFDNWYTAGQWSSIPTSVITAGIYKDLDWTPDAVSKWFQSVAAACRKEDSVIHGILRPLERLLKTLQDFTPHPTAALAFTFIPSHSTAFGVEKLSERDALTSAWYFPRPAEQKAIKSFFSRGLHSKAGLNGEFYETTLLAMAIWMGKDVENILHLKCIGLLEEIPFDEDSLRCEHIVHRTSTTWHVPRMRAVDSTFDSITPHKALALCIQKIVPWHGRARLIDMLPATSIPWAERCYQRMSRELNCSARRARLIARDYMEKWPRKSAQRYKWKLRASSRADAGLARRSFSWSRNQRGAPAAPTRQRSKPKCVFRRS